MAWEPSGWQATSQNEVNETLIQVSQRAFTPRVMAFVTVTPSRC
jgi:hypothetical protein